MSAAARELRVMHAITGLVIGRNSSLEEFAQWVCGLAPRGLMEFVPKSDPMTQSHLRGCEDVSERALGECAAIVKVHDLDPTARNVFNFRKLTS